MIFSKERCPKCGNKTVAVDPDNIHADYCVECGYVMWLLVVCSTVFFGYSRR